MAYSIVHKFCPEYILPSRYESYLLFSCHVHSYVLLMFTTLSMSILSLGNKHTKAIDSSTSLTPCVSIFGPQTSQPPPHNPAPPLETAEKATTTCSGAEDSQKELSPLSHHIATLPDMKNPDIFKQIDRKREELSGDSGNIPPGNHFHDEKGRAGVMGPKMVKDAAMTVMGIKEACCEISTAISEGVPIFNDRDHKGCYEIYRQTAEKILQHCSIGGVQQELRDALDLAAKQSKPYIQAWIMRNAFDAILHDVTETKPDITYKDACHKVSLAISVGVPAYNRGDYGGCYKIYKKTAEKILEQCSVKSVQLVLRSALDTVTQQSTSKERALKIRWAFDAILREYV